MRLRLLFALAVLGGLAVVPAADAYRFGAKLDSTVQPSNAETAHPCDPAYPGRRCTWVMNEAYGRPDRGHRASWRGTIRRIRLIAGEAGQFRLQIVRVRQTASGFEAKAIRNGRIIRYDGQPDLDEPYVVEVFRVNIPIRRGQRLAIRTRETSTLRCSSGGPNTLVFYPPLRWGAGFRDSTGDEGCWLLLEAVVRRGNY
jgi:hypothetical protein